MNNQKSNVLKFSDGITKESLTKNNSKTPRNVLETFKMLRNVLFVSNNYPDLKDTALELVDEMIAEYKPED